jgi:hypothetical protein
MKIILQIQTYSHVVIGLIIKRRYFNSLLVVEYGLFVVRAKVVGICKVFEHSIFFLELEAYLE